MYIISKLLAIMDHKITFFKNYVLQMLLLLNFSEYKVTLLFLIKAHITKVLFSNINTVQRYILLIFTV